MSFTVRKLKKKQQDINSKRCPPCKGHCKQGIACIDRARAYSIFAAIAEDRADHISDEQILWALAVSGDLDVVE